MQDGELPWGTQVQSRLDGQFAMILRRVRAQPEPWYEVECVLGIEVWRRGDFDVLSPITDDDATQSR